MNENPNTTIDWYTEVSNLFGKEEIIHKKVYSGYGEYANEENNMYGINVIRV